MADARQYFLNSKIQLIITVKPRGFWGQAKTRGKSGSAVNRGFGFWGPKLAKIGGKGL